MAPDPEPAASATGVPEPGAAPSPVRGQPGNAAAGAAAEAGLADDMAPPPSQDTPKYEVLDLLAEGAEGRVYLVRDHDMRRHVAMKVMHPETARNPRHVQRFLAEARRTASLDHSGIAAVHDLGYSASGELYFTMRLVEGRTLREVIDALRAGDEPTVREWTIVRLVQALQRAASAIEFAHFNGLLHRDLKPENIALGDFQEVLVLDWGLSKRLGHDEAAAASPFPPEGLKVTQLGAVKGTPMYMSPEQARGAVDVLDERADVFSLGALLYEILTHCPPYDGNTVEEVLAHAKAGRVVPIEARLRGRDVPRTLVATAERALSSDPGDRHQSAREFAEDLQDFLEGTKEREARAAEAGRLREGASRLEKRRKDLLAEGVRLDGLAADLRRGLAPHAPQEEKSRLWQLEDAAVRTRVEAADAQARAMDMVSQALALDPESRPTRELCALLYFERFLDAERKGNLEDAAWLMRMVERYNDGPLDAVLRAAGSVLVTSSPDGARVTLRARAEQGRRLRPAATIELGRVPVVHGELPLGPCELLVQLAGYETARIPMKLRRGEQRMVHVTLLPSGTVPHGYAWVPGGPFLSGPELTEVHVDDFMIGERPVLLREYARWLDDVFARDPEGAAAHVPWVESHGALLRIDGGRHVFCPPSPVSRRPIVEHPDLPVVGVSRASAEAYADWLTQTTGRRHRLPSEAEWEKAARGTDGRLYPWGDAFDPTFCSMIDSTAGHANLRPAGAFRDDESPYGVRDMAGGVREWCRDDVDAGRRQAVCRGGAWYLRPKECTVTSRWIVDADTRNPGVGFRLCVEPPASEKRPQS
ncbi:MAG: Serine/threonine-protein kinase PknD [Planctomycetes bacterium]|nr:Serine/threonine-protein kinase PknD [Planctomycetota bacterium]